MTKRCSQQCRHGEQGYVLLVLLLSLALLSIAFTVAIQGVAFEIKRDREEELIHRGVQYSRAVRKFIKAFGRYPNSIEELENTNNIRFLRKRYMDPITGKEFKVLHLMDLPGSKPVVGAATVTSLVSQQGRSSGALNASSGQPGPVAGSSSEPQTSESDDENRLELPKRIQSDGSDASSRGQQSRQLTPALPTQQPGRGPMVGVASVSKTVTIREFNKKNHYNDWQFVYDPSTDRGVLLTTPNQPALRAARLVDGQNEESSLRSLGANAAQRNPANGAQLESPTSQ
jgi:type II secretory pathway pseudopilin PulG